MNNLLRENQDKRLNLPLPMLLCFAMYCFWQMGYIYFMGPSLTIDGRTPLPISMDNVTLLIVAGYVLSILLMTFKPHRVLMAQRLSAVAALICTLGLFLPMGEGGLRTLIYAQAFFCCFMIGFELFLMINILTVDCTLEHLTMAYGSCFILIAIVQNDFYPITFPQFRFVSVVALVLMLNFFFRIPAHPGAYPGYIKKTDTFIPPKKLLIGTYIVAFIGSIMAVSGPAIAGEVKHGVFILYVVDAVASVSIYLLYKKFNFNPFRQITIYMAAGCIGFLLMFAASDVPALAPMACGFIGIGMIPCQMIPLYGGAVMKRYPSKIISPALVGLAMAAVIVQSSMVEVFRETPVLLNLVYAVTLVILVIIYLQIEPIFMYSSGKIILNTQDGEENIVIATPPKVEIKATDRQLLGAMNTLTKRELEVVDLICYGYTNSDIAKMLFISEYTVKDHTKNIYRKMDVHSRHELASVINRLRNL